MTTTSSHSHALIIGGGIIGLLSARELAAAGLRVTVLERGPIGTESSWAGGGILSPLKPWDTPEAITALCRWSQQAYPDLTASLLKNTGVDPEWLRSGLLACAVDDLDRATQWCLDADVRHEVLAPVDLPSLEPALAPTDASSLYLPEIGQVRNPRLIAALRAELGAQGVSLLEHTPVIGLEQEGNAIRHVLTESGPYTADHYVIAAGAWSGLISPNLSRSLAVAPIKGQMLVFQAEAGLLRSIVLKGGRYLIPRRDGRILVGSTVEQAGYDKHVTEAARKELSAFAYGILPGLRDYPIEKHWAGLRPGSPEGIPRIARHPAIANLYFNCGHFRNGFVMAPASARLLADLVLDRPPIVQPAPYRLPAETAAEGDAAAG